MINCFVDSPIDLQERPVDIEEEKHHDLLEKKKNDLRVHCRLDSEAGRV